MLTVSSAVYMATPSIRMMAPTLTAGLVSLRMLNGSGSTSGLLPATCRCITSPMAAGHTALSVHTASLAATRHLTVSLVDPVTWFDPGAHRMCTTEAGLEARRDWLRNEQIFLDCRSWDKPAVVRRDKQNSTAGTWLLVFPNRLNGNGLPAN